MFSKFLRNSGWVLLAAAVLVAATATVDGSAPKGVGGVVFGGEGIGSVVGGSVITEGGDWAGSGDGVPDVAAPTMEIGDPTPAQLVDLETIAQQKGMDLEDAIRLYAWQEPFSILVQKVRESFPTAFSGARIEDDGSAWIGFAGSVPAAALGWIEGFGHPVEMRPGRGFTEAELDARLVAAYNAVSQQKDIVARAYSRYDIGTGRLLVLVEPIAPTSTAEGKAALVSQLLSRLTATLSDVSLQVVDRLEGGGDTLIYGGRVMWGASGCTAGFTVTNGSARGISTAAHCVESPGGTMTWFYAVVLPTYGQHLGTWGDVQWNWDANDTFLDDFVANTSGTDYRDVAAVGSAIEGQTLCRFGWKSGPTCDTVSSRNVCQPDNGACHLTEMRHRYGEDGDSGGPWYYGNTAYGIHEGWVWYPFHYGDVYTPAGYFDEALGTWVATS